MKKTNEIYYTVTESQWTFSDEFRYDSILMFRTGNPLQDRKSAIDYILQMKNDDPSYSYKLSLRIQNTTDLEDDLVLIHFDGNAVIENFVNGEVLFYKDKGLLEEEDIYYVGDFTFFNGSQALKELTLNYQIEAATKAGDLSQLQELLNENGTQQIYNVLLIAITAGHLEIVKYCNEKGADLAFNNNQPLMLATWDEKVDIVSYLLENKHGWQSIAYDLLCRASEIGSLEILELLFHNTYYSQPDIIGAIREADLFGGTVSLRFLINKIDSIREIINELILQACQNANFEAVNFLFEFKPDLSGHTYDILEISTEYGKLDVIKKVFQYQRIDIEACTYILNLAVQNERFGVAQFLIEKGVLFNEETITCIFKSTTERFSGIHSQFPQDEVVHKEFLIDHIISTNPGYGLQLAIIFTPALNEKYPEYALGADFNL